MSCGVPPDGTNTQEVPQVSLLYEDTYNYSCLAGYETDYGTVTECLANGTLSLYNLTINVGKYRYHARSINLHSRN